MNQIKLQWMLKYFGIFIFIPLKGISYIPFLGKSLYNVLLAINTDKKIEKLESIEEFENARSLRRKTLKLLPRRYQSILWRSEGNDCLYRLKDNQASWLAFENALQTLGQSPSLYGVSKPHEIYFGAAASSIYLGKMTEAAIYTSKYEDLIRYFGPNQSSEYYEKNLEWLKRNLKKESGGNEQFKKD